MDDESRVNNGYTWDLCICTLVFDRSDEWWNHQNPYTNSESVQRSRHFTIKVKRCTNNPDSLNKKYFKNLKTDGT